MQSEIERMEPSWRDPAQLILQLVEGKESPEEFSGSKKHQEIKANVSQKRGARCHRKQTAKFGRWATWF